jgi:hypothetical protein
MVDGSTGVSIMFEPQLNDAVSLRSYLLQLTKVAFKYLRIWIVVVSKAMDTGSASYSTLLQSISNFPCEVNVRLTTAHRMAYVVRSVSDEVAKSAARYEGLLRDDAGMAVTLNRLSEPLFSAHTEFLQLFPSINFWVAAAMLSTSTLASLCTADTILLPKGIRASMRPMIDAFIECCKAHIGLEAPPGSTPSDKTSKKRAYEPMLLSELKFVKAKHRADGQTVLYIYSSFMECNSKIIE